MTTSLEGIKGLIRRNEGLAENLSSTEVKHYAAEILSRLRKGNTVKMLEQYLRQLRRPGSRWSEISPAVQRLAGQVHALFHADASVHRA